MFRRFPLLSRMTQVIRLPGPRMPTQKDRSFERVATPHMEYVYRVARRLARDEHEAEDLVQETYLKAYKAFERFEMREYGIRPWLLRILNNTFLNRAERQNRAPRAVDHESLEKLSPAGTSRQVGDVDEPLNFENLDAEVKTAVGKLLPEFRSVLLLWGTKDHTYQEIAEILDVPIGTVMSRLHRARRQLTETLRDYAKANRLIVTKELG